MKEKIKVISYIYRNHKQEILVFDHVSFPEAGTQVVGGTVEVGEDLKEALAREVLEESGLVISVSDLKKIGETTFYRSDRPEVNYRHYFELESTNLPDTWVHIVKSDGEDNGMLFNFFWLPASEAKKRMVGNFGELIPE